MCKHACASVCMCILNRRIVRKKDAIIANYNKSTVLFLITFNKDFNLSDDWTGRITKKTM